MKINLKNATLVIIFRYFLGQPGDPYLPEYKTAGPLLLELAVDCEMIWMLSKCCYLLLDRFFYMGKLSLTVHPFQDDPVGFGNIIIKELKA